MTGYIERRVMVTGNTSNHLEKSYTHGEIGLVLEDNERLLLVQLDSNKYEQPYFYEKREVTLVKD